MKTLDQIVLEIEKNNKEIEQKLNANIILAKELKNLNQEELDWIPVSTACKMWDISPAKMYQKINDGKLTTRRFDSKTYVSKSEVLSINDKVV